jgi:predicted neuraminidase
MNMSMRAAFPHSMARAALALALALAATALKPAGAQQGKAGIDQPPGVVIDYSPAASRSYIGSPSIAVLPGGGYVASHDFFGPGSSNNRSALFASSDRGATWQKLGELDGQWWSTLFVHRQALYILGTTKEYGNIVIRRSTDDGRTWSEPSLLRDDGQYHCAPMPMLVHNGRLWRAFERRDPPLGWGINFRAGMLSAPLDADLLKASSWTVSNFLPSDKTWLDGTFTAWLEGNAVAAANGDVLNILRVDTAGYPEKAAVVRIGGDGRTATFDPANDFIDFPGGAKKFTIRYDAESKLYWSLASIVPPQYRKGKPGGVRNTLALTCSADLMRWEVRRIVLQHPDVKTHGFQYVDWLVEDDDLIAVCRTAYDDDQGGAHNFHDANFLTFHRIADFRNPPAADAVPLGRAISSEFIYETAPFPSCHASTIAETADGLVAAWFGGTREGHSDVGIWLSRHATGKWTAPVEVASDPQHPCWNPVLFQPPDGPLVLFYKVGPSPRTWWGMLCTSADGGRTWNEAKRLPDGVVGPIKNKPIALAGGDILSPSSSEHDGWRVHFERSSDGGKTWAAMPAVNDGKAIRAIQPSILSLGGDRLLAVGRTAQGKVFRISSSDAGKTWGEMTLTDLPNPNAGTDAVTLRDGRHVLVYNHTGKGRSPLNVAISRDAAAWQPIAVLENEPGEYSYPAIIQTRDGLVHITYTWKRQRIKHVVLDVQQPAP